MLNVLIQNNVSILKFVIDVIDIMINAPFLLKIILTLDRLWNPEELTNLVVFLTSDKANYITRTVIQVDGGFTKSSY
ncbi:hypothetical protein LCGC14_1144080 [marine sediment metagenome]|uniref:SDR family oxidoreductase n=1 Tax=marine sediment metagenome TaxID=412755 RepID=A0A0F9M297_9ZZZZ